MENEESGCDNHPDAVEGEIPESLVNQEIESQAALKFVTPQTAEMLQALLHDMDVLFPYASQDAKMTAAAGILISTSRINVAVQIVKPALNSMKMGPSGVIVPAG